MKINNREVNLSSIEIDGVDRRDYPDFCDAYISYAEYTDGTVILDEQELDFLTTELGDEVNRLAHESLY